MKRLWKPMVSVWLVASCVLAQAGRPPAEKAPAPRRPAAVQAGQKVKRTFVPAGRAKGKGHPVHGAVAVGGLKPSRRVRELVSGASSIVRATVTEVREVGEGTLTLESRSYDVTAWRATVQIAAVLKGDPSLAGTTASVQFYSAFGPAWGQLQPGQHGLLFVADDGSPFDLDWPLLPLAPDTPDPRQGLSPLDAVGQYLLLSLRPSAAPDVLLSCVEGALDLGIAGKGLEPLWVLAASQEPGVSGAGLWGLVELKDARAVPAAVSFLLRDPPEAVWEVRSIEHGLKKLDDPALAGAILPLLSSPAADVRGAGIHALRMMKNPAAMPVLYGLLSDQDPLNQFDAIMAMAETAGFESGPPSYAKGPAWIAMDKAGRRNFRDSMTSMDAFAENPQPYLDWWEQWWQEEGKAKYGSLPPPK